MSKMMTKPLLEEDFEVTPKDVSLQIVKQSIKSTGSTRSTYYDRKESDLNYEITKQFKWNEQIEQQSLVKFLLEWISYTILFCLLYNQTKNTRNFCIIFHKNTFLSNMYSIFALVIIFLNVSNYCGSISNKNDKK